MPDRRPSISELLEQASHQLNIQLTRVLLIFQSYSSLSYDYGLDYGDESSTRMLRPLCSLPLERKVTNSMQTSRNFDPSLQPFDRNFPRIFVGSMIPLKLLPSAWEPSGLAVDKLYTWYLVQYTGPPWRAQARMRSGPRGVMVSPLPRFGVMVHYISGTWYSTHGHFGELRLGWDQARVVSWYPPPQFRRNGL